jgi:transglutaminase-like putative cysteine protease
MIYQVRHTTIYEYSGPVSLAHHVLRLRPRDLDYQRCLHHEIEIEPKPALLERHEDFYGNALQFLSLESPHHTLTITARSKVERLTPTLPEPDATTPWEQVRDRFQGEQVSAEMAGADFVYDSPRIKTSKAFAAFAAPSFSRGRPIFSGVLDLVRRLHSEFCFDTEATTVSTPVEDFFKKKRGVCQDFAHLQIACLRSIGLPARYVSGYLETDPPPGKEKLVGADASHAWVAFFIANICWVDV